MSIKKITVPEPVVEIPPTPTKPRVFINLYEQIYQTLLHGNNKPILLEAVKQTFDKCFIEHKEKSVIAKMKRILRDDFAVNTKDMFKTTTPTGLE